MSSDLRAALNQIRETRGTLTPAVVVEEATDPNHPLHHHFEWDDTEAARKFRLQQARGLLRVHFTEVVGETPHKIRAFLPVPDAEGLNDWTPIQEVAQDPVASAVVLKAMRREWAQMKRRYGAHAEFIAMVQRDITGEESTG